VRGQVKQQQQQAKYCHDKALWSSNRTAKQIAFH